MTENVEIIEPNQEVMLLEEKAEVIVGSKECQKRRREVDDVVPEARKMARKALVTLKKLMDDPDAKIRFMAAKEVIERGFGRSSTPQAAPPNVQIAIKILQ